MRFGEPIVFAPGLFTGTAALPHDFDNLQTTYTLIVPDYAIGFMLDATASGGGGGVGAAGTGGGGGGSGESVRQVWFDVTPGDTLTITIPLGGVPGGLAPFGYTDGQSGSVLQIVSALRGGCALISLRGGEGGFAAPVYRGGRCGPNCVPYTSSSGTPAAAPACHGAMFPFRGLEFLSSASFLRIASGGGAGSDGVNPNGAANCLAIVDNVGAIVKTAYSTPASVVVSNNLMGSAVGARGGMGGGNIWAQASQGGINAAGEDQYNTGGISNGYMTPSTNANLTNYGGGGGGGGGVNRGGFGGDGFARIRFAYSK